MIKESKLKSGKNPQNPKIKPRAKKRKAEDLEISLPQLEQIAKSLKKKIDLEVREIKYAPVKDVLTLLAAGTFLAASIVIPGLSLGLKEFFKRDDDSYPDKDEWKRFNPSYLARTLKRLEKQKLIEFSKEGKLEVIKITNQGRKRILKYALNEIEIEKPRRWDGRWYFVTYDIPKKKDWLRNIMRDFLERLGFYRFHESLYIYPYSCQNEVEFLREYLDVSEYVKVLVVNQIENDQVFRDYFGL